MALNKEAYIRYKIIDASLNNLQMRYPSMDDLIGVLKKRLGKTFTVSTIQKDIKAMKEDEELGFLAPIKFSKSQNGYYYSDKNFSINQIPLQENEIAALVAASEMLQVFSGSRVSQSFDTAVGKIMTSLKEKYDNKRKVLPLVFIEKSPKQSGWEHFEFLFKAIKDQTPFSFVHYSFDLNEFSTDVLHPYQLIEFNNYWYIIGYSVTRKTIRVCGLDKIFNPIELKLQFNDSKLKEVKKYNENMYGVKPIQGQKKQKITFGAASYRANYLKSHPLHFSQKIETVCFKGVFIFTIDVIPTYELIRWFFTHSDDVQVYKNEFVINEIKELVNSTLTTYKK